MDPSIQINFDENSRALLNVLLAFIMFGVALDLSFDDIKRAFRKPKGTMLGLFSQFVLLPAATFLLVSVWQPLPGIVLGLFLIAACPGGNISNFMSSLAKADLGLSVSLTAISTLLCLFFTPFNFEFWAGLYPETRELLRTVDLNAFDLFKTVLMLLILPVIAGIIMRTKQPDLTSKVQRPIRWVSIIIFFGFVAVALSKNQHVFLEYASMVALLVFIHNALALLIGYGLGRVGKLGERASRSLSIETGIQNSGLGLIICFNFFPEIGEMALIAAWWGVWHIISGLIVAGTWSKFAPK